MWIFGDGSLVWRPSFDFAERRRAYVAGWTRRFWQGSPDHRGEPHAPGRVATLVPDADAWCGGVAYRIEPRTRDDVLAHLDLREQAGFERHAVGLCDGEGVVPFAEGTVYVAAPSNPHFLGPLPEREIAAYVRQSRGPSGANSEYVLRLRDALRELAIDDAHVEAVARALEEFGPPF